MPNHFLCKHAEELKELTEKDVPISQIAILFGCEDRAIVRACKKLNIAYSSKTGPRPGSMSPLWKGGKTISAQGYVMVYAPDHHSCASRNEHRAARENDRSYNRKKYVQEHRLVMEAHLGRYLVENEVVHHKNGEKTDNRIQNLELCSSNGSHLASSLKGKCPTWTEAGKRNLQREAASRRGKRRSEIPGFGALPCK